MSPRLRCLLVYLLFAAAVSWAQETVRRVSPMALGDATAELLYTPLPPCRIIDTRLGGGTIPSDGTRGFKVTGTTGFSSQGGNETGCGVPVDATAALINFVAVNPQGGGNLRGSAYPAPVPSIGSIINYQALTPNLNIANAAAFPICDSSIETCDVDIRIYVNGAATDLVGDVLGFFRKFPDGGITTLQLADGAVTPLKINAAGATSGHALMFNGTNVQWQLPPQGTITQVSAGTGLTGGGSSGNVTLNVAFGGTGSSILAARADHSHYARTIIVSPVGTPTENGTALLSALSGISGATSENPYLLKIEPGHYETGTAALLMKSYVDIEGSGESITRITGTGGFPGDGTIIGASNAELREVTVESTGGGSQPAALVSAGVEMSVRDATLKASDGFYWAQPIYQSGGSLSLRNVKIIASNGGSSGNIAIYMTGTHSLTLQDVSITTSGPNFNYGTFVPGTLTAARVTMNISSTTGNAYGHYSFSNGVLNMTDSTINVSSSGASAYGLYLQAGNLRNTTVNASSTVAANVDGLAVQSTSSIAGCNISATSVGLAVGIHDFFSVMTVTDSSVSGKFGVIVENDTATNPQIVVEQSRISGSTLTFLVEAGATARIGGSRLAGGAVSGTATCAFVYDENFVSFASTCP